MLAYVDWGRQAYFKGPTGSTPTSYDVDDLKEFGMSNSGSLSPSSLTIPAGYGVLLYSGSYHGGTPGSLYGPPKTSNTE